MRRLLLVLSLVLVLNLIVGCGNTGIDGTFEPTNKFNPTIQFDARTAYIRSMGMEFIFSCEILNMKDLKTDRPFKAIKFTNEKTNQAFYAEILEVDSSGKIQTIEIDFSLLGGTYKRRQE